MASLTSIFRSDWPFKRNKGSAFSALYLFPFPFYLFGMSDEQLPYSPIYIKAWTILSVTLGLVLLGMFFLGDHLLSAGHSAWDLIRWLARPII
jgi:hypothetical protein